MGMKRTNCVNCGGIIDSNAAKCPFCGTSYVDMSPGDIQIGGRFVIRFSDISDQHLFNAYVSEYSVMLDSKSIRDAKGRLREKNRKAIRFTIIAEENE